MHMETKNNNQIPIGEPPLPPPAHFDVEQMATARPVKPLPAGQWRKSVHALQRIFGRNVIAVAVIITGIVIGFAVATASLELGSQPVAATDDSVASTNQSRAEQATVSGEIEPAAVVAVEKEETPRVEKRENQPTRRLRRTTPSFEFDQEFGQPRNRPRLVSVIH